MTVADPRSDRHRGAWAATALSDTIGHMRSTLALLLVPFLAQCQSQVQALRFTESVRIWEGMGSSPFYGFDGLWLPEHGVICEMQLPKGVLPNAGVPWRIVAKFGKANQLPRKHDRSIRAEVHVPSALADRLVALAKRGQEESDEQIALAAALIAAGVVGSDPLERELLVIMARDAQTSHR